MEQPNIRIPRYPDYGRVRKFLPLMAGQQYQIFESMNNIIWEHRGTPQNTRDWSRPEEWIPQILSGSEQALAFHLWQGSDGSINPRHLSSLWRFCYFYELVQFDSAGYISISTKGEDFIKNPLGETVRKIDYLEGLFHLLAIVAERGPGKRSDLLPPFADFLANYSRLKSNSTITTNWFHRMANLVNRGFVIREGNVYRISQEGLSYLEQAEAFLSSAKSDKTESTLQEIRKLAQLHEDLLRKKITDTLAMINPYQFEFLIRRLLEAMGYEDVEVTSPSKDGGVDVVANIEVGITTVREVVQVKRHRGTIGRPVLDQLRGSLHRFDANRGTIITTGKFSKDTHKAAFERGAAPITLIDGDRLINLLIENSIGARKDSLTLLKFEPSDFVFEDETQEL